MLRHKFTKINSLHSSFQTGHLDGVFDVHEAKGACRNNNIGPGLGSHFDPQYAHALFFLRLIEKHEAAAAATEGTVPAAGHFNPF
jgi:hypothetical protein